MLQPLMHNIQTVFRINYFTKRYSQNTSTFFTIHHNERCIKEVQWHNDKNDFIVKQKRRGLQIFFMRTKYIKHKASEAQKLRTH